MKLTYDEPRGERRARSEAARHVRRARALEERARKLLMGGSEWHVDAIEVAMVQRVVIVRAAVELLRWGLS